MCGWEGCGFRRKVQTYFSCSRLVLKYPATPVTTTRPPNARLRRREESLASAVCAREVEGSEGKFGSYTYFQASPFEPNQSFIGIRATRV